MSDSNAQEPKHKGEGRLPTLWEAIFILVVAALLILGSVKIWEADAHIALVLSCAIAACMAMFLLKYDWEVVEEGILAAIMMGMQAVLILFTVGILVGCWIRSGVVPSMIYYGLSILSPSIFLIAALLICSIVSLATGSSWGTSGTIGIALMGIAAGLDIPAPITAGFVISGAYFGDKMSPLSDTTNLAPAMAGTDLFQHIRAMCWTTGPSYIIVLIIAWFLGMGHSSGTLDLEKISAIQILMAKEFVISPIALIPPALVIGLAACKKPALPSIFAGVLAGMALAAIRGTNFGEMLDVMQNGYAPTLAAAIAEAGEDMAAIGAILSENQLTISPAAAADASGILNELLARGGLQSMTWSNSLVLCALAFGGVLDRCRFLEVLIDVLLKRVKSVGGYVLAVAISCVLANMFAADQYISIVLPGRMFKGAFDQKGLHPRMLSRSLEDFGTLSSALVPWNTCGAYQTNTLGVPTLEYIPYAFLNYINPIFAVVITYMGIGVTWRGKNGEPVIAKNRPKELEEA